MAVTTAFSNGITAIKNTITGAITWFFESGKRVVTTFANGIKSAFTGAVDAVKGGLQKIRNMLPFSDAKEGPLSTLTLSGQRTMTTYAHGLTLGQDALRLPWSRAWSVPSHAGARAVKKVNLTGKDTDGQTTDEEAGDSAGSGKKVIIQKLLMQVDLKKLKDLQGLLEILKEVEDYAEGNGTEEPDGDPDAVPDPA